MKRPLTIAGVLCLAAMPFALCAQDAPADPAAGDDGFESDLARRSYAVGIYFGGRIKSGVKEGESIDADAVIEGARAILSGEQSLDYASGVSIGQMLKRDDIGVDAEALVAALRDLLTGAEPKLGDEGVQAEISAIQKEIQDRRMEERRLEQEEWTKRMAEAAPKNKAEGEAFLAENGKRDGVITTESGLQYEVIAPAADDAAKPEETDRVSVIYKGTLLDGTVFDDSQGKTRSFGVNRVIKGWTEGLQLMGKGSKFRFWIPGELAYGMSPRMGGEIEAMDTLVFDVELVDILPTPQATTPPVSIKDARPARKPITAVTPPVAVEIPPKKKDGEPKDGDGKEDGEKKGKDD